MKVEFSAYSSSWTIVRPPDAGFTRLFWLSFRRIALFLVTLSASLPERLRRVVVMISLRFGDAIALLSYYRRVELKLLTISSRRVAAGSSDRRVASAIGEPGGKPLPVDGARRDAARPPSLIRMARISGWAQHASS